MSRSIPPHFKSSRAPDTRANLGALIPVQRDDAELSPMRASVPTLIFHGAPPPKPTQTMIPPPPTPRRPLEELIAQELDVAPTRPRLSEIALGSADVIDEDDDDHERSTPLLAQTFRSSSARSERPPALLARRFEALPKRAHFAIGAIAHTLLAAAIVASVAPSRPRALAKLAARDASSIASALSERSSAAAKPHGCVAGASRVVTKRAMVSAGVLTTSDGERVALGVLAAPREANAFALDPTSLRISSSARVTSLAPMRRAIPSLRDADLVDATPDASLEPDRRARVEPLGAYAIATRRGGAVWIGRAKDDRAEPDRGSLVRVSSSGARAGAPAIVALGDEALAAWAEQGAGSPSWSIRFVRWRPGSPPPPPQDFALPAGGLGAHAMSPSLAAIDADRVVVAWTEGPVARHQVRAQLVDARGARIGEPITLSPDATNAGQGQLAMANDGRGVVAFFAQAAGGFELEATAIACE